MNSLTPLFLSRESERLGSDHELRRLYATGGVERIRPGIYIDSAAWGRMDSDERYRTRVRAVAAVSARDAQFSHDSAAALWRLPTLGPWSTRVHSAGTWRGGGTSRVGAVTHGQGTDESPVTIDGVLVTSLARTLVDVARTTPMVRSVAMLDDGLRAPRKHEFRHPFAPEPPPLELLMDHLDRLGHAHGRARAIRAIEFADPLSESPGESFTRVQFLSLGYPPPQLQREFFDEQGRIGIADFYWPELDLALEFDGKSKYGNARKFLRGLSLGQVLMREKDRERRFRRVVTSFDRLNWDLVNDRTGLARYLARYGLVASR